MFKEVSSAWGLLSERGQAFHDEGLGSTATSQEACIDISRREAKEEPREGGFVRGSWPTPLIIM
eukprot:scaffold2012_cov134-Skeletonema_dohrnii-CCMP3373.AAC.3